MAVKSIYTKYFQKSKVFLYPLLGFKRGIKVVPSETYLAWDPFYIPEDIKYILINEGQFFHDLYPWVKTMVNTYNKHIYIAALNGDFEKKGFTNIISLIPECDTITKLNAICSLCEEPALFSFRKSNSKEQIVVTSEIYKPLCRKCYNKSI